MSHILIIDDDIHINEMLEEVLIQEGYQVSHAYSGTEALLFLANEKPDLILLDLIMKKRDRPWQRRHCRRDIEASVCLQEIRIIPVKKISAGAS